MARAKLKKTIFASVVILLAIGVALMFSMWVNGSSSGGALKLPVGSSTPVISLGETHGLILASDGSLWSWGSDFLGWPVLGTSNAANQPRLCRIGHDTNWVGVSAAAEHNLALKSDGTIWAWGENFQAQLGDGTKAKMQKSPVPSIPGNDWIQVAAGDDSSFALKKDGTLWAWGMNWAGELGVGFTNRFVSNAVQVGTGTNWIKVWGGGLATVGKQSDGSLWYWGENPNPAFAQGANQILVPTRVSPDTNWTDVGFGTEDTVFAVKSDGTLWAWGRQAHVYTSVTNQSLDATPIRLGTDSDWRSISACGNWWCQGLIKKDGSLWLMDASAGKANGPRSPYGPVRFRRLEFAKEYVAFAAGAAHDVPPGVHIPVGVVLTRDGEVWTWGMVLGDARRKTFDALAQNFANHLHLKVQFGDPTSQTRPTPWQLPHDEPEEPGTPSKK
jgi:alpha-tubulin suppressor-like RCC1 family protein